MTKMAARRLLSSFLVLLLIAIVAKGQATTTGRLMGTTTDTQGGVIPAAVIVARNIRTGSGFRAISNNVGIWEVASVPTGNYTVSVTVQGFRTAVFKEINVGIGTTATVNATMQIGLTDLVIVTASKFEEEVLNAPATATVVPEQMIRYSPSQNLAEVLRSVPGINVAQTSARGISVTGRAASGAMPATQLALVDGRTIYQDYFGYVAWDLVPASLDDVNQMEVIRGPASAVWGAYALNGVVNIVTKPPREMLGTAFTLGIGTFDRSGGAADSNRGSLYYVSASHAQALNDRWAFKLTGGAFTQDAFARPQGTFPNPYHTPYPPFTNEGTTQPKVDGRVDYDFPDGKRHFTFSGGYVSSSGIQHGSAGGVRGDVSSSYGKVDYVHGTLRITGYVNTLAADQSFLVLFTATGQPLPYIVRTRTYHVEVGDSRKVQAKHLISYGGSLRHSHFDLSAAPEARRRNEAGLYFQDEILFSDHFRWIVGTRLDRFDILKGVVVSPRTTFMVKPAPGQTFRVSYNRAYVAPSVFLNYMQMTWNYQIDLGIIVPQLAGNSYSFPVHLAGNRHLRQQSLNAYEVGYTATVAKGHASLGATFYIDDTKDDFGGFQAVSYTSQDPPPGWPLPPFVLDALIAANAFGPGWGLPLLYGEQNLGKVRNKGLELSSDVRLNRYVTGFANYSWQAQPQGKNTDIAGLNLPPANRFNAGLDFDYRRYLGNLSIGYTGRAYWQDIIGAPYAGWTNPFTAVNVSGGIRWGRDRKYQAMLKISNLANTPIQNHIFGDILKRQISGEFKVRL